MSTASVKRLAQSALSVLLSLSLVASMGFAWSALVKPAKAYAEEGVPEVVVEEEPAILDEETLEMLPSDDELFSGYVDKAFYGDNGVSLFGNYGEDKLTAGALAIYRAIKAKCMLVANGQLDSTQFTFEYSDLGIDNTMTDAEYGSPIVVNDAVSADAWNYFMEKRLGTSDIYDVIDCLLVDCPYELYWFDKTYGHSISVFQTYKYDGTKLVAGSRVSVSMPVAKAYSTADARGTYSVNTTLTSAACAAAANANEIISQNEGKSDYQKMLAYKNAICNLTSYNYDAIDSTIDTPYGDPWQLIYVFDGDSNTKVVCEGYSKAFQLLCDKSSFQGDVTCYIMTGYTPGGHMWNNVVVDGSTYLVDVTNSDAGTIGAGGQLFLAGTEVSSDGSYTFEWRPFVNGTTKYTITYVYKDETKDLYADTNVLNLAPSKYVEPPASVKIDAVVNPEPITYGYSESQAPTLNVSASILNNPGDYTLSYQWFKTGPGEIQEIAGAAASTYKIPTGLSVGSYQFNCVVIMEDGAGVEKERPASNPITVNVDQKPVSVSGINGLITNKVYDGTTNIDGTLGIDLNGVLDTDAGNVTATSSTYAFVSANVGSEIDVTVSNIALNGSAAGNYKLTSATYKEKGSITPRSLATATVTLPKDTYSYTGSAIKPVPTVKLGSETVPASDYDVTYEANPVNVGEYSVTITGKRNHTGSPTQTINYTIEPASITKAVVDAPTILFDGNGHKPNVTAYSGSKVVDADNYEISYADDGKEVGMHEITVMAKSDGNYTGTLTATFEVVAVEITACDLSATSFTYNGNIQKPAVTVKAGNLVLTEGTHYSVTYPAATTNAGTYNVTVKGIGQFASYAGKTMAYTINKKQVSPTVSLQYASATYNGSQLRPAVTVLDGNAKLSASDYTAAYSNNVNAGTAKVTVTLKGNYAGTATKTFNIAPQKLTAGKVTLAASEYAWNGKAKTPGVTVKNAAGKAIASKATKSNANVTVTYASGRKNVGTYKVTIKGKGNYTGTVTKTFKINPKGTSLKSVAAAKRAFTAKWAKVSTKMSKSRVTGYQVRYSTSSKMKSAKTLSVTGYSKVSKKVTGLKAAKKYYVQVRTYMTVGKVKYYSAWSKSKAVTTKK